MTITAAEIIDAIHDLADLSPDWVTADRDVQGIPYVRDGQPHCIIGHALWRLGVINSSFGKRLVANHLAIPDLLEHLGITATPSEQMWLRCAQIMQDDGKRWCDVVGVSDSIPLHSNATQLVGA